MFLIISENDCPEIIKVKCPLIANSVLVFYRQQFLMKIRFCLCVKGNYSIFHNLITLVVRMFLCIYQIKDNNNVAKACYLNMNMSANMPKNELGHCHVR